LDEISVLTAPVAGVNIVVQPKSVALASLPAAVLVLVLAFPLVLTPQERRARVLITEKIDESRLHVLAGNTRSEANAQNDRGPVADDFVMEHMMLQLQRPPEREQAVRQFIDQLHDSTSPNFHRWLTANEFGQTYGPAQEDLDAVTGWLQARGFTVNSVYPSGMLIDFSGAAGQVSEAFHTEIHYLEVNGRQHIANMSDPRVPAALAPAVAGVVSLHDFMPHSMKKRHADYTFTSSGSVSQAVAPADLATIYNLNPLFSGGNTGAGQTVVVIEDSDLYKASDWNTFRTTFGLSRYTSGSLTTVHPAPPTGRSNCRDPGVADGDDGEAIADAEWASAAAPGAAIQVASCADTRTTFGGLIALQNLINAGSRPPAIMSVSYGECEAENGASANATFSAAYQQAVAEGVSVFVSAGDEGAASCDAGASAATHGIGVSGWASTPYNVAVGGTDFGDTAENATSAYWNSTNTSTYGSAKSYIPEIPWNDSCASALLAAFYSFTTTYGAEGFCNSNTARQNDFVVVAAGSGGPSGCATGSPSTGGVVGGTCAGYAKPSWQSGVKGIPNDGVRDIPDVSLFAADGVWGHFYVTCWSDIRNGGAPCTGAPSGWAGAGGTSFSSPIMAGIQALVNQKTGSAQGNPNYVYYKLAAKQYSASGLAACNSASSASEAGACNFHNVARGDIDVNCSGTQSCYESTAGNPGQGGRHHGFGSQGGEGDGALSTSSQSYAPAYGAFSGWSFATGIGSVNAYNLVNNWKAGQ
jgi:subtilase family serine protease